MRNGSDLFRPNKKYIYYIYPNFWAIKIAMISIWGKAIAEKENLFSKIIDVSYSEKGV